MRKADIEAIIVSMGRITTALLLVLLIMSCTAEKAVQNDFLGVYRIIKTDENGETAATRTLNQIELTKDSYIYRFDRNNDNRFSEDEIIQKPCRFSVDGSNAPFLQVAGDPDKIYLSPDSYYDLLFEKETSEGSRVTLYTKNARSQTSPLKRRLEEGSYDIIKIRENGKILNIATLGRVTLTETRYTTEIDGNGDHIIDEGETATAAYTLQENDGGEKYITLSGSNSAIWLCSEFNYDLLLKKIDEFGNETIIYLNKGEKR